jgi:hypothetical protein
MERRAISRWLALSFVVLVGVLLRYPRFPNEFAGDTLELHYFTDAIRDVGFIGFVMSPLSWFGVYPVSYPLGVPILAAILGSLTGMASDDALALAAILCGVMGTLGSFCLAHRLTGSFSAGLLCAAAFSLSGYHISQAIAGMSGRALVMSFFPIVLLLLALGSTGRVLQWKMTSFLVLPVLIVLNVAMAASHRLFLLAALTEVIILAGLAGYRWIVPLFPQGIRKVVPSGALLLLISAGLLYLGYQNLDVGPRSGPAFLGDFLTTSDRQIFAAGYFLEQAYSIGPLIPLAAFGFLAAVSERFAWTRMLQVVTVAFAALFFLASPSFTIVVISPFLGVLIGIGWDRLRAARSRPRSWAARGSKVAVVGVLALCLIMPGYFIYETQRANRNPDGTSFYTDQESVESGIFLHHDAPSETFITPDLTDARRVMADGHVATVSSETTLFIADPSLRDKITIQYRLQSADLKDPQFYTDVLQLFLQTKSLYAAQDWIIPGGGYGLGGHWGQAVTLQGSAGRILEAYGANHVLLNNNRAAHPIATLARSNYYAEYSNSIETVYLLQIKSGCIHGLPGCP